MTSIRRAKQCLKDQCGQETEIAGASPYKLVEFIHDLLAAVAKLAARLYEESRVEASSGRASRRRLYPGYVVLAIRQVLARPEVHLPRWFKPPSPGDPGPPVPPLFPRLP